MSNRNLLVDVAKGIGLVLVVLGHSGIEFGHYLIYMFHMPLFFFCLVCFIRIEVSMNY